MKLYIAVLDEVPDHMVPVLVAHTMLGADMHFHRHFVHNVSDYPDVDIDNPISIYFDWKKDSFKKCVVRVNKKEFDKISNLPYTYCGHENTVLAGMDTCAIPLPCRNEDLPNVLKFAKLWSPK